MARKFLYFIVVLIVLVLVALLVMRIWSKELTRFAFVPRTAFEQLPALQPGAYADSKMWISRPGTPNDPAQYLPKGFARGPQGKAWVFFVHPTSYLARERWNGAINDTDSSRRAAMFVQGMASVFNGEAAVFAPRYRQAAFGSFLVNQPESRSAIALAHGDVLAAFDAFLKQVPADAPIVLAGHSQGSLHLLHLLQERVKGAPVQNRIVAAYLIGWPVSVQHDLPETGLARCAAPDQAGCVVSYLSFADPPDASMMIDAYRAAPGLDGQRKGAEPWLCTNPLTGGASADAPAKANPGTLVPKSDTKDEEMLNGAVPARCDAGTGLLMIGSPPDVGPFVLPGNNYHVYDYPLFWKALRADVARREAGWFKARGK
ncbi:DUF3089 domain-containing protein [Novosphingobium cyanobacteriorum]|uniref:DUF3089 domain-containing protein n=1 Tax=Novosphingobium cyanobacteriorum TaxID=3024215 RepID=A0ABT6CF27_9SPHN|nr:DUF3089 domain-containing protein [Novosphingobium cyanobacteriorum]MDF8332514.1 DUF3089 domain-containing protein [Novosphingobium cyanobacteriorum]